MPPTDFLQVTDNAIARAPANSLKNITDPIVINSLNTTKFEEISTGYLVTIWDDLKYRNPADDPNMEKAFVLDGTIGANGSFTLSRPNPKQHPGTPAIGALVVSKHLKDLALAVNKIEGRQTETYNVREGVIVAGVRYYARGDGTTDDAPALQQIMNKISADGGGIMWFPKGTYMVRSSVYIRDNVTVDGVRGGSVLTSDVERLLGIFRSDETTPIYSGWTCRNIKFLGNVTEEPDIIQANRTRDPSPFHAIKIVGDQCPPDLVDDFGQPVVGPHIENIVIDGIIVHNMASLPITVFGTLGRHITQNCIFRNCKDAGWVANQEVICVNNHSVGSSDNGLSLSRLNKKVVCVGNVIENAAIHGIWLAGYNSSIGPTEFTCTGNVVKNVGFSCINLDYGPSNGVISDNYLYQGYNRGTFDHKEDRADGITVAGAGGGVHATKLLIADNVIDSPARNGITIKELDNSVIQGNLIINPGTQFKANGTTEILAGDTQSNHGICLISAGSYSRVLVKNNYLIENRSTPLGNWPIYKPDTGGVTSRGNDVSGNWRNVSNALAITDRVSAGNPVTLQVSGGNGTNGGDTSVNARWNFPGSGRLILRNADGSLLNIHSTSTTNAAKATILLSAGANDDDYIGAITASRNGSTSSSTLAFRVYRNNLLSSDGKSAPFWISGLDANSRGIVGLGGGQVLQRTPVNNVSYTANANDYIIAYTALTANRTVSLKDATTLDPTQAYVIQDESGQAGTYNINITPLAGTINGQSSISINRPYAGVFVYSDGTNWFAQGFFNASQSQNLTLTTTGTSGAATLVGNTLNIPQYTTSGGGGGVNYYQPIISDSFNATNGSSNTYTLNQQNAGVLLVFLNGQQLQSSEFSPSGQNVTVTPSEGPLVSGDKVSVVYTQAATFSGGTSSVDLEFTDATKGLILRSPNGTRYRITVANDGSLITGVVT